MKRCVFMGSSLKDLKRFPARFRIASATRSIRRRMETSPAAAKALRGFGGRAVLELIDDFDGDAFRAVYTIRFAETVYVLHAFQKKSKSGIATPQRDMEIIRSRLRDAELHYRMRATGKLQS